MSLIAPVLEGSGLMQVLLEDMTKILDFLGKEMTLAQFHALLWITKFWKNLL